MENCQTLVYKTIVHAVVIKYLHFSSHKFGFDNTSFEISSCIQVVQVSSSTHFARILSKSASKNEEKANSPFAMGNRYLSKCLFFLGPLLGPWGPQDPKNPSPIPDKKKIKIYFLWVLYFNSPPPSQNRRANPLLLFPGVIVILYLPDKKLLVHQMGIIMEFKAHINYAFKSTFPSTQTK